MTQLITERDDIEEGRTYGFSLDKKTVIIHLTKGDVVRPEDLTNQQGPEGMMLEVVEDHFEEVTVEGTFGERYTLTGIHYLNLDGPWTWLRTPEGDSAGQVLELEVVSLTEGEA